MRARRQRRVADRRGSERIELRRQMAVAADRLDEVGGADDDPRVDAGGAAGADGVAFAASGVQLSNALRVSVALLNAA